MWLCFLVLCSVPWITSGTEVISDSVEVAQENDPCQVPFNGSGGFCRPTRKCPSYSRMFFETKSLEAISCFPLSSRLICCPSELSILNKRSGGLNYTKPSYQIDSCGSLLERTYLLSFYEVNETAKAMEDMGYEIYGHRVSGDELYDFNFTNGTVEGTYSDGLPPIHFVPGGVDAQQHLANYMAIIGQKYGETIDWYCDGVLINWQWVLTAAHCFKREPNTVRLGEYDLGNDTRHREEDPQDYGIQKYVFYPDYRFPSTNHDIALIKLDRQTYISRPDINPICLPWGEKAIKSHVGSEVTLTGWGATKYAGTMTDVLQEANITVFDPNVCDVAYSTLKDYHEAFPTGIKEETHICAGDEEGGKDACQGDSGGPIVYFEENQYYLAGIVSSGHGCGLKEFPGIYVPINNPKYLSWIKEEAFS